MSVPRLGSAAGLTRTMVRAPAGTPVTELVLLAVAMRRVPGVLIADVDTAAGCAVVTHDSGVPVASLARAADRVGIAARVGRAATAARAVGGARAAPARTRPRTLALLAAGGLATLAVLATFEPVLRRHPVLVSLLVLGASVAARAAWLHRARRS